MWLHHKIENKKTDPGRLIWRCDHFKLKVAINRYALQKVEDIDVRNYFSCNSYGRIP
jgi:hypothetical protein